MRPKLVRPIPGAAILHKMIGITNSLTNASTTAPMMRSRPVNLSSLDVQRTAPAIARTQYRSLATFIVESMASLRKLVIISEILDILPAKS